MVLVVDPWHWLEKDGTFPTNNLRLRRRIIRVARFIEYGGPLQPRREPRDPGRVQAPSGTPSLSWPNAGDEDRERRDRGRLSRVFERRGGHPQLAGDGVGVRHDGAGHAGSPPPAGGAIVASRTTDAELEKSGYRAVSYLRPPRCPLAVRDGLVLDS
jgi:hypothetical protein